MAHHPLQRSHVSKTDKIILVSHENITLNQMKIWDFIFAHTSMHDLLAGKQHSLPMSFILNYFYNTRNVAWLQSDLLKMSAIVVNRIKYSPGQPSSCRALENVAIQDGYFFYSYDPVIAGAIGDPASRIVDICLTTQRQFTCKAALFLYQLCLFFLAKDEPPIMRIGDFASYIGVKCNRNVTKSWLDPYPLQQAISEVNAKTELIASYEWVPDRIHGMMIQFTVQKKLSDKM